jgi:hypothetical protein
MSKLTIKVPTEGDFQLNVTQFRSPMAAEITSVQTRTMQQHFPIRSGQPDIEFTVQFRNTSDRDKFKDMVRRHQQHVQNIPTDWVTLFWPERNILNWTGFLTLYPVAIKRFDYAPKVVFGVILIDSLMSEHTFASSTSAPFANVLGPQIPFDFSLLTGLVDSLIKLPTFPSAGSTPAPVTTVVNSASPNPTLPSLPGVGS